MGRSSLEISPSGCGRNQSIPTTFEGSGIDNKAYERSATDLDFTTNHDSNGHRDVRSYELNQLRQKTPQKHETKEETRITEKSGQDTTRTQKETERIRSSKVWQVVATGIMALTHMGIGTIFGHAAVTLPELTNTNSTDVVLSANEAALFASLTNLGGAAGCVITGALLVRLGHRKTLFLGLPVTAASWLGLAFAKAPWLMQALRFILGVTSGFTAPATSLYILEISHKKFRGVFFGILTTVRQMGFLLVYVLGSTNLGWRNVSITCAGISLLPLFGLFFLPNSPRWLVTQGRVEDAQRSLAFYRGKHYDSTPELNAIVEQLGENAQEKNGFVAQLRIMSDPPILRALLKLLCLSTLSTLSGYVVVTTYTVPILRSTEADLDAYLSTIIIGAVRVCGTLIHLAIVDRMGRKPILVPAYALGAFCVACLGGYFYMQNTSQDISQWGWVPLTSMVILIFCMGVGQPVVSIMQGELIPTSVRASGMSLILVFMFLAGFAIAQTYPLLSGAIGEHGAFWLYSAGGLAVAVFGGLTLPETRGQSLEEITKRPERRASLTPSCA